MVVFNNGVQLIFKDELAKIMDGVQSLQEKNNSLEESVSHYQKVIEDNLAGVRCKELEKVIQEQQRELDIRSDKIHNLHNNLKLLKDDCDDLSDCNKAWVAKHKDQQAIIEFQKQDIERLVKLNSKLINEREELKFEIKHSREAYTRNLAAYLMSH